MSEIELRIGPTAEEVQFVIAKGRAITSFEIRESDSSAEILETLREILEYVGEAAQVTPMPYAPPSAMFTPPVPVPDPPKVSGVSWDGDIDSLPVM